MCALCVRMCVCVCDGCVRRMGVRRVCVVCAFVCVCMCVCVRWMCASCVHVQRARYGCVRPLYANMTMQRKDTRHPVLEGTTSLPFFSLFLFSPHEKTGTLALEWRQQRAEVADSAIEKER